MGGNRARLGKGERQMLDTNASTDRTRCGRGKLSWRSAVTLSFFSLSAASDSLTGHPWSKGWIPNNTFSLPATPLRKLRLRAIQTEATRETGFYPGLENIRTLTRTGLSFVWSLYAWAPDATSRHMWPASSRDACRVGNVTAWGWRWTS